MCLGKHMNKEAKMCSQSSGAFVRFWLCLMQRRIFERLDRLSRRQCLLLLLLHPLPIIFALLLLLAGVVLALQLKPCHFHMQPVTSDF